MRNRSKLVYGVGINDSETPIANRVNGKLIQCPFYIRWRKMIERCYSKKWHENHPTYIGCTVCDEWPGVNQ